MFSEPLLRYAAAHGLLDEADFCYTENQILALYGADAPDELPAVTLPESPTPGALLDAYTDIAVSRGLLEDTVTRRDLFAARLMGLVTPLPSQVNRQFAALYADAPARATDWFYALCNANGYIQRERIAKNICWQTETEYGALDVTINLSKPEKDPRDIAAAGRAQSVVYPKCQLCRENEGYAGRLDHPARQNLRVIPLTLTGQPWFFQYSPYAYYNEHCIVLDAQHTPMKIDRACFTQLLEFVSQFPHYFVGSNADLPVVGGSILSHAHFQGGADRFPMADAPIERHVTLEGYEDVECGIVKWMMSVLRIRSANRERLVDLADRVLTAWRGYTDASQAVIAYTGDTPHHTITPIARFRDGAYELDLVLRDNHTTPEHPLGLYHPHAELHHIKKENIGLIEVMGRAILPARLKTELEAVRQWIASGMPETADDAVTKHADWVRGFIGNYPPDADFAQVLRDETGKVFMQVLMQCGVFDRTEEGQAAFVRFLSQIKGIASR
ncbi:MAG: UDP-glucose--hexose-1-phosphate uridylyltransferase [Oscillospiraceae bacterium]|nr:UDP-glucose--hexose-1-phosphate uridylyltransferase [Oscillospiraceae bacterium]